VSSSSRDKCRIPDNDQPAPQPPNLLRWFVHIRLTIFAVYAAIYERQRRRLSQSRAGYSIVGEMIAADKKHKPTNNTS
jgi:hypothetical protein